MGKRPEAISHNSVYFDGEQYVFSGEEIKDIIDWADELEVENERLRTRLTDARGAIASLDEDAFGWASGDMEIGVAPWPLKEELLSHIDDALKEGTDD